MDKTEGHVKSGNTGKCKNLKIWIELFEQGLVASVPANININFPLFWGNKAQMLEAFSQ